MEKKINFKFLNYKHYNKFLSDLENDKIGDDSIVFIQDKLRIWARGKEYICDGQYTSSINTEDGLVVKDGYDNPILQIKLSRDRISIWDGKGTPIYFSYTPSEDFNAFVLNINESINVLLQTKVDRGDLNAYITKLQHTSDLKLKQNKLTAGRGILINANDEISTIIDNLIYVIVDDLPDSSEADPNKIYILDCGNGLYIQYVVKNRQWVSLGQLNTNVDLSGYLKKSVADLLYQPIGDYLTASSLLGYALQEDIDALNNRLKNYVQYDYLNNYQLKGDYATKDWVYSIFVKKIDVYTPTSGISGETAGSSDPEIIVTPGLNVTITVDDFLDRTSTNPVLNRIIYAALQDKVNSSALSNYVTNTTYESGMSSKLDKLIAGNGIEISAQNVISTNLDTQLYIIVSSLSAVQDPNSNKIYLVEVPNGNGGYIYELYRYKDGKWVRIGNTTTNIDLSEYLKISEANSLYLTKRDDFVFIQDLQSILSSYSPLSRVVAIENSLNNYATYSFVANNYQPKGEYLTLSTAKSIFVLKVDVYTPTYGDSEGGSGSYDPTIIVSGGGSDVTVDSFLDVNSTNPVLNRVIALALLDKADKSDLNKYVKLADINVYVEPLLSLYETKSDHLSDLEGKLDILAPGKGIRIINNTVSTNLADVAYSGRYEDLSGIPERIIVDSRLDGNSTNPVLNKAIYEELLNKVNSSSLSNYVTSSVYEAGINSKQDKLTAGSGITISAQNVISTNIDTQLYVIVSSTSIVDNPDPNKIYLVETPDGNGGVLYQQYRYKNGQWVPIGQLTAQVDLSEYLKSADAALLYQEKRNDFVFTQGLLTILSQYSPLARVTALEDSLTNCIRYDYAEGRYQLKGDYLGKAEAEDIYVKKVDVYTPNSGESSGEGGIGGGGTSTLSGQSNVVVDSILSPNSTNPVENRAIYNALSQKQGVLTAGNGVEITNNNVINVTLDTSIFVLVSNLDILNPNPNKIYVLDYIENGEHIYEEYRWQNGSWVLLSQKQLDVNLSDYLTTSLAEALHQTMYGYMQDTYQLKGDYADKTWVENNFTKSQVIIPPSNPNITVDSVLDDTSANPVENRVIATALLSKVDNSTLRDYAQKSELSSKADVSSLSNYVQASDLTSALSLKQDVLQAGDGISIVNNIISSTVDTNLIVITDNLLNVTTPSVNKIYLLETVEDGDIVYIEYRWKNNDWVEIGQRTPEVDLSNYYTKLEADLLHNTITGSYLSKVEASLIYQTKISDYATSEDIEELDEKFDDYATKLALNALKTYADNKFLSSGNYVSADDVATALQVLQTIIDQKYVLKRDVYRPNEVEGWSTSEATAIAIQGASGGSSTGGSSVVNNMVTLSESSYQQLVDTNMIEETTYYFTYEDEEETNTNWTFGNTFPVILAGNGLGEFPITLT